MPRPTKIRFAFSLVLLLSWSLLSAAFAQDITVSAGTPISLVAYSNSGAPDQSGFNCGQNFAQTCYGGTVAPNGNINWTVDGVPASSTYDNIDGTPYSCAQDDAGHDMFCYYLYDESGFTAVLPSGNHTVTAYIDSSQDPYAVFSTTWTVYVSKQVPSLSVSCSPNPITYGSQNTSCVASQSAGTGTLNWTINGAAWTTTGVNGSAGGFAGWSAGTYTIGVSYSGDGSYEGTSASTQLTINKASPNVGTTLSPSTISYGDSFAASVHVDCNASCGSVDYRVDGNEWGTVQLDGNGNFSATRGSGDSGSHTIEINYLGDANHNAVGSAATLTVNKATPNVAVTLTPSTISYGENFTASVHVNCNTSCGSVDYRLDGNEWGTVPLDGAGNFSAPNSSGGAGTHTIQINYLGDSNHTAASGSATLTVGKLTTSLDVSCSPNPLTFGSQNTTCLAFQPAGTGTESWAINGSPWTTTATSGSATGFAGIAPGSYTISVAYSGDDNYNPATASTVLVIDPGPTQNGTIYSYQIGNGQGALGYSPNGNVVAYTDSVNGTWSLGYDGLDRLTSAAQQQPSAPQTNYCWSYDSFGNRLDQTVTTSTCQQSGPTSWAHYDTSNRITATNLQAANFADNYDPAGNINNDGRNQYLYDGDGRVCAVATQPLIAGEPVTFTQYLYDADGRRVAKGSVPSLTCDPAVNGFTLSSAYILGQGGEQVTEVGSSGAWIHSNLFAGGKLLATYDNNGVHFFVTDWLGSRRVQADYTGAVEEKFLSSPFGETPMSQFAGVTEHQFTGKERDTESGLDNFGFRYYGSNMGRFMSPDDQGGHLGDPQTLNKYVYARNNPLSYVDPDGHDFNLAGCGSTNTATCQNNLVGTTSTDANGKSTFTATVISNGANGLQDQAGNSYSGTVTPAGVSFTQNGSNTSYSGSWINGSADTSFTQSGGALNGFSFNFSQPNTATGQRLAGTFSYGDDMSASQAGAALEKAGFSHSYFDAIFNPIHGYDVTHYRGGGDPNTGKGAAHFILDDPYKVDDGFVMGPVRAGDFHFGETDPRGAGRLYDHVVHEVIPSLLTPH